MKDIIINKTNIKPGENRQVNLNTYFLPTRSFIEIPVFVFRSIHPGPVLLLMAGMHGDEINGIEIIRKLLRGNNFDNINCGTVIAIPIINTISFLYKTRELPDGRDLNRCFPGSSKGSLGSRIAHDLMHEILPQVDFGIDFHTGGAKINNYPQIRCTFEDPKNLEFAKLFGAPFIMNAGFREGTFRMEAAEKGKTILVYEAGESCRFSKVAITEGINGCLRVMNNLNMLESDLPKPVTIILNSNRWLRASMSGLFRTSKKYGTYFEENDIIGTISDPYGEEEVELIAPYNGFIIAVNNSPVINEGDALIHIGKE